MTKPIFVISLATPPPLRHIAPALTASVRLLCHWSRTLKKVENANWYALVTVPGKEYVAASLLQKRFGCFAYVPTEMVVRRKTRHSKGQEEWGRAIAPRYVIARFVGPVPWMFVFNIDIVVGVVSMNDQPHPLDNRSVYSLMARVPNGRLEVEPTVLVDGRIVVTKQRIVCESAMPPNGVKAPFSIGQMARLSSGQFAGHEVRVDQITGNAAKVLIPLLGVTRSIRVPVDTLQAA